MGDLGETRVFSADLTRRSGEVSVVEGVKTYVSFCICIYYSEANLHHVYVSSVV